MSRIGIDFKIKYIYIDDKRIRLQIWDTAGQERFRTITTAYYRGAHGIVFVYDVTNRASFNAIDECVRNVRIHAAANVALMLIGHQLDSEESQYSEANRAVETSEAQMYADQQGIGVFREVHVKDHDAVNDAFHSFARVTYDRVVGNEHAVGNETTQRPRMAKKNNRLLVL